jgi:mono/diheme cytochrome c family protein
VTTNDEVRTVPELLHTDHYVIKNGHQDMPPEGPRVKTEENWDLVNYVRSLAKKKVRPEAVVNDEAHVRRIRS